MNKNTLPYQKPFEIIKLEKCAPPPSSEGNDWFHYVIAQEGNRIEGYKQGETNAVTLGLKQMVEQINDRRLGKRGVPRSKPGPKKATGHE